MNLKPYPRRAPKVYDCGSRGHLSVAQIMRESGLSNSSVYQRIQRGISGDALCKPAQRGQKPSGIYRTEHVPHGANGNLYLAICLAKRFSRSAPSVAELRDEFGMCRATAYRWRRAWLDANGIAA